MKKVWISIIFSYGLLIPSLGQFQLEWIDTTTQMDYSFMYFFTNRPAIISESGQVGFEDKYKHGTYSLTFGNYYLDRDSFVIKYKASYGDNPALEVPRNENFMYKIYENLVVKKGIRHFEIVIPGYAKTFSDQRHNFMKGLKESYQDKMIEELLSSHMPGQMNGVRINITRPSNLQKKVPLTIFFSITFYLA